MVRVVEVQTLKVMNRTSLSSSFRTCSACHSILLFSNSMNPLISPELHKNWSGWSYPTGLLAPAPFPPALELPSQFSVQRPQTPCPARTVGRSLLLPPQVWRASSQLYLALLLVGKHQGQVLMATSTPGLPPSRLFFVTDRHSGLRFLVDTGVKVSVLPVSRYIVPLPLQVTSCKQSTTPASQPLVPSLTPSTSG